MTIDRAAIAKRLPSGFNVQIDGDVMSFTTTHQGKPYEIRVNDFRDAVVSAAIDCCHRFAERGPA